MEKLKQRFLSASHSLSIEELRELWYSSSYEDYDILHLICFELFGRIDTMKMENICRSERND